MWASPKRSFVLSSPPVQFTTSRNIAFVVAILVKDEKVVNLRGHKAMIVGNMGQRSLQFADRDCWTLGRFWNHGLVPRYDVSSTIPPQPIETAKIVQDGWATGIATVLGAARATCGGFSKIMRGSTRTMKRKVTSIFFFNRTACAGWAMAFCLLPPALILMVNYDD